MLLKEILDLLGNCPIGFIRKDSFKTDFTGIKMLTKDQSVFLPNVLYFGHVRMLPRNLNVNYCTNFLIYGPENDCLRAYPGNTPMNLLYLDQSVDAFAVYNRIQEIFLESQQVVTGMRLFLDALFNDEGLQGICDVDFSDKTVLLNGKACSWAGSSTRYPEFARRAWMYFVVPDEAVADMPVSDVCAAYTLENHRPKAQAMLAELSYCRETEDGLEERCDFAIREEYRLWSNANAGTLIIGALYVSTVFVCMALAILSVKTLSTLEDERRRFSVLYRLGADVKMKKAILFKQIGAFFLMPFVFPLLMTVPLGVIFGKVYEIWDFAGLSGQKAM